MKTTFNEKLIAYLALISGLCISAVAVYYSVVGLTAIFAAATIPIVIMGVTLEISKLVATVWLKQNWKIAPTSIKTYLIIAVGILMLITSIGIFGFLSKSHLDQYAPSGEIVAKISVYDEKIKVLQENISSARRTLQQMDSQVDQLLGRTDTNFGAERSVQVRRQQARERESLQKEITSSQQEIANLVSQRSPLAGQLRKVEAEVGPIKYIATFIYGETDQTVLEKAVAWMIIILIVVFDPLAVVLLLASQFSFQHFKNQQMDTIKPFITDEADKHEQSLTEETVDSVQESDSVFPQDQYIVPETTDSPQEIVRNLNIVDSYIQNEEQTQSNRWTSARENTISPEEYTNAIRKKREQQITRYAQLVRSNQMQISDVPEEFVSSVKAKV
jgi:hypothetical protein